MDNNLVRPGLCTSVKKHLPAIRKKLREKVPALSYKELRRAREPFYISKIQDLYEDGYTMVAEFMEDTERMESELHAKAPEGLQLKHLYDAPEMLNGLIKTLKIIEKFDDNGMLSDVVVNLLYLGNEFANGIDDFRWIAEKVISKALSVSEKVDDNGQIRAAVLCSMGKLYAQNKFYKNANEQFQMALNICGGKDWTVSKTDQTLLSRVICLEYCTSLDHCAQNLLRRPSDYNRAKLICDTAIKIAEMSGSNTILGDAYISYGRILSSMKLHDQALEMFDKSVKQFRYSGDLRKVAVAELNTAVCLESLKKFDDCSRHAKRANKIAISHNFLEEQARSFELMAHAEHSLGNNIVATEEFAKAAEIYQQLDQPEKMRKSNCYAAIAKARDIIEPYVELVLKSNNEKFGENQYMTKLLNWESRLEPFWDTVIDGKPVVSMTDTTFSTLEEDLKEPTLLFAFNNSNQSLLTSGMGRKKSVFLECVSEELLVRMQSFK